MSEQQVPPIIENDFDDQVSHDDDDDDDDEFIKVLEKEDSDLIEFPKEDNNTVLIKTLKTQYPDAIGLRYKGPTGAWRAIKEVDDALVPPKEGWGGTVYFITYHGHNKRQANDTPSGGEPVAKNIKTVNPLLEDLAVIQLAFETTASDLKAHIEEKYGPLEACIVNTERDTGQSKGFGFVRFKEEEAAKAALEGESELHGKKILVRRKKVKPMKLFVNGLPNGTSQDDVNSYFSQFGTITDSHVPKDFKGFAFFTMSSSADAHNVMKQKHEFRGNLLNVRRRKEPEEAAASSGYGFGYAAPPSFSSGGRGGRGRGGYRGRGRGQHSFGFQGHGSMHPPRDQLKDMLYQFLTS